MQNLCQLRVLPSHVKKCERNICSVKRKGLEELVVRLSQFCCILPNPLNSFVYVPMGEYLSRQVLKVLFLNTVLYWGAWGKVTGTDALKFLLI